MTGTKSRTLLDYASVQLDVADPTRSCLILIDYQNEYVAGKLALDDAEDALSVAQGVLATFREAGSPVIHVVHHAKPGSALFDPETVMVAIPEPLSPRGDEVVVTKSQPNAFAGTDLENIVRATGCTNLVVIGFMTHMCVSSTVRAASELGFQSTIVADACATRDLPNPVDPSLAIPAAQLHASSLAAMSDRFAAVVPRL